MDKKFLSIQEVAALLSIQEQTIRLWLNQGKLKGKKIGRLWRVEPAELDRFILGESPREPFKDIVLFKGCQQDLFILGINALGPLHQGQKQIREALERGVNVKILLLDPACEEFQIRSKREEYKNGKQSGRLLAELNASIAICKDINNLKEDPAILGHQTGAIDLRFHDKQPTRSLIIADPSSFLGKCNVNHYPLGDGKRGAEGGQYTLIAGGEATDEFIEHVNYFRKLWESARSVDLEIK
jgi:excisionase family DNA binding protein